MKHLECKGCRDREQLLVELRRDVSAFKERVEHLDPENLALRQRVQKLKHDRDVACRTLVEGKAPTPQLLTDESPL